MTYWALIYEYVALFFCLLMLLAYLNDKRIPRRSHKAFFIFLGSICCSAGLRLVASQVAINYSQTSRLFDIIMSWQFFTVSFAAIIFSIYLLLLLHIKFKGKILLNLMYFVLMVSNIVVAALNPYLHWAFSIKNRVMEVTALGHWIYRADALLVSVCLVLTARNKKRVKSIPVIQLIFVTVSGIMAYIAQLYFHIPIINVALVAIAMTVYFYQQNASTVTDSVTGLFSRKFMGEFLRNRFLDEKKFGVITVAMDDFKFINKTYGVETGDHLLFQIGQFLKGMKGSFYVFRFGSDQFCVIVNKGIDLIDVIANQIWNRFRHPWFDENQAAIMMSASICCMECPRDASSYSELIELIDYSMSVAKNTRKGRVTSAAEIDTDKIKKDKAIEKAVRMALDRDDLMVYYQPIFSVEKGVYNSAEALVRLHDEELGWVSPEVFIPIAEKSGMIVEMGEKILEKVCRFIHDFKLKDTTVEYIEVNISPVQLIQLNFADRVKAILEKYGVTPEQINIEITETATLGAATAVNQNMNALLDYGITFSLDDYGSGNANIDYINHMPFKIIKIDKYIIWDSFKNSKAGITLEYTIGMLNALELHIVAEGVETEEMKEQLADYGCHYMQGWLYSKAVPDTEFVALLEDQSA